MNLNGFLSSNGNVYGSLGADLVVAVEANPSGVATQPLIKLRVGDVIYAIPTGGGGGGSSDYNMLTNKPKINNVILQDELSLHSLGIQEEITFSGEATEYLNGEGVFTTPPFYVPINYDTAEQDTGIKWIDGKTLYQKTLIKQNVSGSAQIDISELNSETAFINGGFIHLTVGANLQLNEYLSATGFSYCHVNGQIIDCQLTGFTGTFYIFLLYTKSN